MLKFPPEEEESIPASLREPFSQLRAYVPYADGDRIRHHIDTAALDAWLRQAELDGAESQKGAQMFAETQNTILRLFSDTGAEQFQTRMAAPSRREIQRSPPRLRVLGLGGEGIAFADAGSNFVYKVHPGDVTKTAMGITSILPADGNRTEVTIGRVPLTSTILRYHRQTILPISTETRIMGVTKQGFLITRQPRLQITPEVTPQQIDDLMLSHGSARLLVEGHQKEVRNSWVVPDGSGNWHLIIDLKPANILLDARGTPRIIDGILVPLTHPVVQANPQLRPFAPAAPQRLF